MAHPVPDQPLYLNPGEMQRYLQELYGLPVVLKLRGDAGVNCPYCLNRHDVNGNGYVEARCEYQPQSIGIGERVFHPNYGLHVFEFEPREGSFSLFPPEYLPPLNLSPI